MIVAPGTATVTLAVDPGDYPEVHKGQPVQVGLIGGGMAQITSGATLGQTVVLADRSAAVPSATTGRAALGGSGAFGGPR